MTATLKNARKRNDVPEHTTTPDGFRADFAQAIDSEIATMVVVNAAMLTLEKALGERAFEADAVWQAWIDTPAFLRKRMPDATAIENELHRQAQWSKLDYSRMQNWPAAVLPYELHLHPIPRDHELPAMCAAVVGTHAVEVTLCIGEA